MARTILNEEKYTQLCAEAVLLAKSILADKGDYLRNVSKLNFLRFELGENEFDEDFIIFIEVSSETDHIPYSIARENCSTKWLEKCDNELSEVKDYYRNKIENSCNSIIGRFSKNA